ncbi:MAG TPA: 5'-methylthioadenosine/S-adenosylhomocysteine nucleosidase [Ktedonobacteraceae bacterium]|nr:5'-methylthioadenosine/S-adenosylhomocysteine nucleosidase [Ktedonobacteraceae bacterium]
MAKLAKPPCAAILTALSVEYRAVRHHLRSIKEEVHKGTVYERGIFLAEAGNWQVGIVQVGVGSGSAATEAERAIAYFHPRVVLFVGVAGGLKDLRLGDVVAATKVYNYESGKAGLSFQVRPEVSISTYRLEQRAKIEAIKNRWLQRLGRPLPDPLPRAFVGPIATGEKVLASTRSATYSFLISAYSDALAVEMEGYGFLKAVHSNPQVDALVVRGISDLIANKRKTDAANYQEVAARHASAFAFEVLANLRPEENLSLESSSLLPGSRLGESYTTFQNAGAIHAPVQIGNSNTINTFFTPKDEIQEGVTHLKQGKTALLFGDYTTGRRHLTEAVKLLSEEQVPEQNAQARYFLALAYLGKERPFGVTIEVWEQVEELMQTVLQLNRCYSYLYVFALFKHDFARNGWKKAQYVHETRQLIQEANNLPRLVSDEENIDLLRKCQARLIQEWEAAGE